MTSRVANQDAAADPRPLRCSSEYRAESIVFGCLLTKNEPMTVYLRSLELAVPPTVLIQSEARDVFAAQPGLTRLGSRLVRTCFDSAAIDTRYTAVAEMTTARRAENPQFFDADTGLLQQPQHQGQERHLRHGGHQAFCRGGAEGCGRLPGNRST